MDATVRVLMKKDMSLTRRFIMFVEGGQQEEDAEEEENRMASPSATKSPSFTLGLTSLTAAFRVDAPHLTS